MTKEQGFYTIIISIVALVALVSLFLNFEPREPFTNSKYKSTNLMGQASAEPLDKLYYEALWIEFQLYEREDPQLEKTNLVGKPFFVKKKYWDQTCDYFSKWAAHVEDSNNEEQFFESCMENNLLKI